MGNQQRIIIATLLLVAVVAYYYWDKIQAMLGTPAATGTGGALQASINAPQVPYNGNTGIAGGTSYVNASGQLNGVNMNTEAAETVVPTYVDTTTLNPTENPALTSYLASKAKSLGTRNLTYFVAKLGGTIAYVQRANNPESVLWPYVEMSRTKGMEAAKAALKDYIVARQSIILP